MWKGIFIQAFHAVHFQAPHLLYLIIFTEKA